MMAQLSALSKAAKLVEVWVVSTVAWMVEKTVDYLVDCLAEKKELPSVALTVLPMVASLAELKGSRKVA